MKLEQKQQIQTAKDALQKAEQAAKIAWANWDKSRSDMYERIALNAQADVGQARMDLHAAKVIGFQVAKSNGDTCGHTHLTAAAAESCHQHLLAWRCGLCGNNKAGWGHCSHGSQNLVCSAEWYNSGVCTITVD